MKHNFKDLTSQRFGHLFVMERAEDKISASGKPYTQWKCKCDCGNTKNILSSSLLRKSRNARSCGCRKMNVRGLAHTTHGHSNKFTSENNKRCSPTYHSYSSMITRCYNKKHNSYEGYGARGIKVCKRWRGDNGFLNFLEDMGIRPKGKTIDRKDNYKGYSPNNCKWSTASEQVRNRRPRTEWKTKKKIRFYFNPELVRLRALLRSNKL